MKVSWPDSPNIVKDMIAEAEKAVQARAQDLNDHRESIAMQRIYWTEIQSMTETPGWVNFVEMAGSEIEKVRSLLEQPAEEHITNSLRGALKYLRQLPTLADLAAAQLAGVEQQEQALSADLEEFVERGA